MDSWEIEKMLRDDNRDKKRTGRGVFSRKGQGSERARVAGGVRFAKNNFKKYEKNSKVKSGNLFETVIPYDKFTTYSEEMKKDMLEQWLLRYSKERIKTDMRISSARLDKILEEFSVEVERSIVRANKSEMNNFKDIGIDKIRFKLLPDDQKYEIVEFWQKEKGMLNKDIAVELGYKNASSLGSKKSIWKEEYENYKGGDNMTDYQDNFLLQGEDTPEIRKNKSEQQSKESAKDNDVVGKMKGEESNNKAEGKVLKNETISFSVEFSGVYGMDNLLDKTEAILSLLNEDKRYEVSFSIKEYK